MSPSCFCGRGWPHANDDPGPPTCPTCGRAWRRDSGREGSAFTLRCEHGTDETCYHPGEICEYWYSPFAHTTCGFGRGRRKSRKEAEVDRLIEQRSRLERAVADLWDRWPH